MITMNNCKQANEYDFNGLSTDTKPTNCAVNSLFLELDTGNFFYFDSGEWHQIPMISGDDNLDLVKARINLMIQKVPPEALQGITSIGSHGFYKCSELQSLTVPSTVTSIGACAFQYCYKLYELIMKPTTPPTLGTNALADTTNLDKIYVPVGTLSAYQDATGWSSYRTIMVEGG